MPKKRLYPGDWRRLACNWAIWLLIPGHAADGGGEKMPRLEQLLARDACWAAASALFSEEALPAPAGELRTAAMYCDCRLWQTAPCASAAEPASAGTSPA